MKLKIGEFARIGQVTVQTLRYYEDMDLLRPAAVDAFTGYRYYMLEQLPRLHRILALKDLGLSLAEITQFLAEDLPMAEMRGMLLLKQTEMRKQVQEQLNRLDRIDARLRMLEQNNAPVQYEVVLKRIEPLRVVSSRGVIPSYWEETPLWMDLFARLERAGLKPAGPCLTVYHAGEPEIDAEVCAPVDGDADPGILTIQELPAVERMACAIHHGPFTGLAAAYAALLTWIDCNGYRIGGPDREVYLRLPEGCNFGGDPKAVTELQVPVIDKGNER